MKRIIMFVIIVLLAIPFNVFADDNETTGDEATVELTADVSSYYVIKLPLCVDVTNNETEFKIYAKGDVDPSKQIVISKKDNSASPIYLVNNDNQDIKYELSIEMNNNLLGSNIIEDYDDDYYTRVTINHDSLKAGKYTYNLELCISLEDIGD